MKAADRSATPHFSARRAAIAVSKAAALGIIALGILFLIVKPGGPSVLALFWILVIFAPVAIRPALFGRIVGAVFAVVGLLILILPGLIQTRVSLQDVLILLPISAACFLFAALIGGVFLVELPLRRLFGLRPDFKKQIETHKESKSRTLQRNKRAMIVAGCVQTLVFLILLAGALAFSFYVTRSLKADQSLSPIVDKLGSGAVITLAALVKLGWTGMLAALCASMALMGLSNAGLAHKGEIYLVNYTWRPAIAFAMFFCVVLVILPVPVFDQREWLSKPHFLSSALLIGSLLGLITGAVGGVVYWVILRPDKQRIAHRN